MKTIAALATALFTAVITLPATAQNQPFCAQRDSIIETLKNSGESLAANGTQSDTQFFEAWSNSKTGSWTMFVTSPTGMACVVATGMMWHSTIQVNNAKNDLRQKTPPSSTARREDKRTLSPHPP